MGRVVWSIRKIDDDGCILVYVYARFVIVSSHTAASFKHLRKAKELVVDIGTEVFVSIVVCAYPRGHKAVWGDLNQWGMLQWLSLSFCVRFGTFVPPLLLMEFSHPNKDSVFNRSQSNKWTEPS